MPKVGDTVEGSLACGGLRGHLHPVRETAASSLEAPPYKGVFRFPNLVVLPRVSSREDSRHHALGMGVSGGGSLATCLRGGVGMTGVPHQQR